MRNLLELYTLLLTNISSPYINKNYAYICNYIETLDVCASEIQILREDFKTQFPTPTKHVAFYEHELFSGRYANTEKVDFAWFNNILNPELAHALRVQLLTNIIAELKDASNQ